jgi:serine/threonine-protein kinase
VDFGVAANTDAHIARTGDIIGTPAYKAPEQARGDAPVDARADIYSLGAVMFEMLTFRKPFQAEDTSKLLHQIVFKAVPEPHTIEASIPHSLSRIVMKAMAKKVDRRYQNAGEMALDIKRYLRRSRRDAQHGESHTKKGKARPYRLARMSLFLSLCSVTLGLAIVAYMMWHAYLP